MLEFTILNESECVIKETTQSANETKIRSFVYRLNNFIFIDKWQRKHHQLKLNELIEAGYKTHFYASGDASQRGDGIHKRNQHDRTI